MKRVPLKIALLYVLAGVVWITLSDRLLFGLQSQLTPRAALIIGSCKGIFYVLLTGFLLYVVVLRYTRHLTASDLRYRSYFDDNPHPMWIVDVRTLAFQAVNQAAIAQYGYSREEFFAMNALELRPPEDRNEAFSKFRELQPGINDIGIWRHSRKDGTLIDVQLIAHLILTRQGGNVMAMAKEIIKVEQPYPQTSHRCRCNAGLAGLKES